MNEESVANEFCEWMEKSQVHAKWPHVISRVEEEAIYFPEIWFEQLNNSKKQNSTQKWMKCDIYNDLIHETLKNCFS